MRDSLWIPGLVALLLGGLLLVGGVALNTPKVETQTVVAGTPWDFAPTGLTPVTATVQWSGGTGATITYLVTNANSPFGFSCGGGGQLIASGEGASGSFSVSVDPGVQYLIYGCDGSSPATLGFKLTLSGGITVVELLSVPPIAGGGILLYLGVRAPVASDAEHARIFGPRSPSGPPERPRDGPT